MADLFSVVDPLGRSVRLTADCYMHHILPRHPELTDLTQLSETIVRPDSIAIDAVYSHRSVYYRRYQQRPERWLKVVVAGDEVVTAHRTRRMKKGEPIQWKA